MMANQELLNIFWNLMYDKCEIDQFYATFSRCEE